MCSESTVRMVEEYAAAIDSDAVALSLHGQPLVASDPRSRDLEAWQFVCGEGPAIEAYGRNATVSIRDTFGSNRWMWLEHAVGTWPFRGIFAFPVAIGAVTLGALTVYRSEPGPMTTADHAVAAGCVDHVIRWFASNILLDDASLDLGEFDAIQRAAGIVMAQSGVDASDALASIRGHCFGSCRSLGAVLDDILTLRLVLT